MQRLSLSACALGLAMALGVAPRPEPAYAQRGMALVPAGSLTVRLNLIGRESYRLVDRLTLQILLQNNHDDPLYLYYLMTWGHNNLSLVVDPLLGLNQFARETGILPPPSASDLVKLAPGHVFGVIRTLSLADANITRAGTYRVRVDYRSPLASDLDLRLPIWSSAQGTIESNVVTITVTD